MAPALVPFVALTWGWRSAFIIAGIAGLLWLVVWIPFYNLPEKVSRVSAGELEPLKQEGGLSSD